MISEPKIELLLEDGHEHAGVEYFYTCYDKDGDYGSFRLEATPHFLGVHVSIFRATLSTCKALKKEVYETAKAMAIKYNFDFVMVVTPHKNLLKFISNGTEKEVGRILNMPMYAIEVI